MTRLLPPIIFIVLLFAACSRPGYNDTLTAADADIESAPDSALSLLEATDCSTFTPADSDYYALLMIQARVKTGHLHHSDSLVQRLQNICLYGDKQLKPRAAFYSSQVAFDSGYLPTAMQYGLEAYTLCENNNYWKAKSAELIADIFAEAYNYTEEGRYRKEAADKYLQAGKIRNHRFALCDLAFNMMNTNKYDFAKNLLDSLSHQIKQENSIDTVLEDYIREAKIAALYGLGDMSQLQDELAQHNADKTTDNATISNLIYQSFGASFNRDSRKAENFLMSAAAKSGNAADSLQVVYAEYQQALDACDFEKAALLSETVLNGQSAIARSVLKESAMSIHSEYFSNLASQRQKKVVLLRFILIFLLILLTITILSIIRYKNIRLKLKTAEIKRGLTTISLMKSQSRNDALLIESLYKSKWETLNMLCREYFDLSSSKELHKFLIQNIEQEISGLSSEESLAAIEKATDKYLHGIISDMKRECPKLKDSDFRFASLVYSGMSVKAICLVLKIRKDTFYQKKSRLIKRIEASNAEHKEEFIKKLSNFEK